MTGWAKNFWGYPSDWGKGSKQRGAETILASFFPFRWFSLLPLSLKMCRFQFRSFCFFALTVMVHVLLWNVPFFPSALLTSKEDTPPISSMLIFSMLWYCLCRIMLHAVLGLPLYTEIVDNQVCYVGWLIPSEPRPCTFWEYLKRSPSLWNLDTISCVFMCLALGKVGRIMLV